MARTFIKVPMPINQRAKQFAMFDAMKGLKEAIAEKEKKCCSKKELTPDRIHEISQVLSSLQSGDQVVIEYYCQYIQQYRQTTGTVKKIDLYWKTLQVDNLFVDFNEIYCLDFKK